MARSLASECIHDLRLSYIQRNELCIALTLAIAVSYQTIPSLLTDIQINYRSNVYPFNLGKYVTYTLSLNCFVCNFIVHLRFVLKRCVLVRTVFQLFVFQVQVYDTDLSLSLSEFAEVFLSFKREVSNANYLPGKCQIVLNASTEASP